MQIFLHLMHWNGYVLAAVRLPMKHFLTITTVNSPKLFHVQCILSINTNVAEDLLKTVSKNVIFYMLTLAWPHINRQITCRYYFERSPSLLTVQFLN